MTIMDDVIVMITIGAVIVVAWFGFGYYLLHRQQQKDESL